MGHLSETLTVFLVLQLSLPVTNSYSIKSLSFQVTLTDNANCNWTAEQCEKAFYDNDPRFNTSKQCFLYNVVVDEGLEPKNCAMICNPDLPFLKQRECASYTACKGKCILTYKLYVGNIY